MPRSLLLVLVGGMCLTLAPVSRGQQEDERWQTKLGRAVSTFGHRNWIVIADAAYPAQTRAGIETVVTSADHLQVLKTVLGGVVAHRHVSPVVYLDAELDFVPEADAPGIDRFRKAIKADLAKYKPRTLPHEQIIDRLDRAGEKFRVLVLKTQAQLPYTSVFVELDCGYWSPEAEKRLREAMPKAEQK